jgi:hypothetical protein
VKRLLALVVGAFGLRALVRRRSTPVVYGGTSVSPADELRSRLAESRTPAPDAGPAAVDDRRADVHNRARGAIDELKS